MTEQVVLPFSQRGQSAVEFALIAPFLFFVFFAIIQLAYMAYASFAVQRAALSIARDAARSDDPELYDPHFQLLYSLGPLAALNRTTLATALASKCSIATNGAKVVVTLKYPMPIWVPLAGEVFGVPLSTSFLQENSTGALMTDILKGLGLDPSILSIPALHLPNVFWMTFTAEAIDENITEFPPR
ncbi:MAG TPA: TadE/TadG family type IV pilus assembly protein [bacterium]|nr:TadE/TadG family type IV pilus assembly protein [bacterium]